ncbi:transcriptional regulator [Sphingosinicella sp. BN140058]|uniref:3'-5' exonuclease n=1 Tax=Sphingosinicella sp. BN140058 TaxID=1892855 RepID=UPI0010125320|nr:transcriptional regulator [Sphingosinicella sp. BN140058]QAY78348.1 transcriptional regulator [Sphingosinicella sp. BN140058]
MHVFIDFEASSLGKTGYPIEVGWVFEDGRSENHLIRPAPQWTDWDERSEAIHGISRDKLADEGTAHDVVARRLIEALAGHRVFASAPSWDGKWLSALLRAAGLPRHAIRLKDTELAQHESAAAILTGLLPPAERMLRVSAILARVRSDGEARPVRHRAVADAEEELRRWREVKRLAEEEASAAI